MSGDPAPLAVIDRPLDFPRLVRRVRLRRRLRRGTALALLAIPVWGLAVVGIQAWVPRTSDLWDQAGDAADPGFLVLFALVGLGVLGLLAVRFSGDTGTVASRLIPVFRKPVHAEVQQDGRPAPALGRVLVHRPRLPLGLVGLLLGGVLFAVATGTNVSAAFRGNHGLGGHIYTVGQDAFFDHAEAGTRATNYFLGTPDGVVIAEDGRPRDGQRWAVVHGSADMAYRVGGHSWLLVGALFALGFVFSLGVLAAIAFRWVSESGRRAAVEHLPLAEALERGRSGGPLTLVLPGAAPRELTFDSLRGKPAATVLRRRRAVLATLSLLVVGAGATVGVLYAVGVLWPPVTRDVRVPPLTAAHFADDRVYVTYDHPNSILDLAALVLGRRPTTAWSGVLGSPADGGPLRYANVDVIRLPRGITAAQAVADVAAFDERQRIYEHGPARLTVASAPGWTAYVSGEADDRQGAFVFADDHWLLWGTTSGSRATDQQLGAIATQATQALHGFGEEHFVSATKRRR